LRVISALPVQHKTDRIVLRSRDNFLQRNAKQPLLT
jgi:hypothetical protein